MARGINVGFKTNAGYVAATVVAQYDNAGAEVADSAGFTGVETVDVVLHGFANGKRNGVTFAASEAAALVNECFQFNS